MCLIGPPHHTSRNLLASTHLLYENPKAVLDKDECREEYQCLHTKMFTKQLVSSEDCNGPFKLLLDDLRFRPKTIRNQSTYRLGILFCTMPVSLFSPSMVDTNPRRLGLVI